MFTTAAVITAINMPIIIMVTIITAIIMRVATNITPMALLIRFIMIMHNITKLITHRTKPQSPNVTKRS